MKTAFTPGPWKTASRFAFGSDETAVECGGNAGHVAALCGGPDAEANACLIAAAPDLYKALEAARREIVFQLRGNETLAKSNATVWGIDAALAKARGKS
jgi:hypothetical protein